MPKMLIDKMNTMDNDAPISDEAKDKLGFMPIACQLAKVLAQKNLADGFVVGVEGSWGSGKSSLVNLALDKLKTVDGEPVVIRFSPWIVGKRSELLRELFSGFMSNATDLLPESERYKFNDLLNRYTKIAHPLAKIGEIASVPGASFIAHFSKLIEKVSRVDKRSLSDLRSDLRDKMKELERPIIVFIDDIDRLEPDEAVEVLRLVRAVSDFPNVVYLLAYDEQVLGTNLGRALSVQDGSAYIEKIVQASFRVPMPIGFDLRNWLMAEIHKILPTSDMSDSARDRLGQSVYTWCSEYIFTPRDVVRVLNAIRLYVVPQAKDIDLADAVFLQIVRIRNPKLHAWIEKYVWGLSTLGGWDTVAPKTRESMGAHLLDSISEDKEDKEHLIHQLGEHLPGFDIPSLHDKEAVFNVYSLAFDDELEQYASGRRLASPHHFRLYFSFSTPAGALSDNDLAAFLDLCVRDQQQAANRFRELCKAARPQGGTMGAVFLDRILEQGPHLSGEDIENLMMVLGDSIDELAHHREIGNYPASCMEWKRTFGLIGLLDESQRKNTLEVLFKNATSLAWLSEIVRRSVIQQGHSGYEAEPEADWLLTADEFECIRTLFIERLRNTEPDILKETPFFLNLLYAWYRCGDPEGVKAWVKEQSAADFGFMDLLSNMKSWSKSTATGVEYTIRPQTLETFFSGVQSVERRLAEIAKSFEHIEEFRQQADELFKSIERDR